MTDLQHYIFYAQREAVENGEEAPTVEHLTELFQHASNSAPTQFNNDCHDPDSGEFCETQNADTDEAEAEQDEYRGSHQPPRNGDPLYALGEGDEYTIPPDVYEHPEWYSFGDHTAEAARVLRSVRGKPDAPVKIYRAAPEGVTHINKGDWVTTARGYAEEHATAQAPNGETWHVYEITVPAKTVRNGGNDIIEWGYWGKDMPARSVKAIKGEDTSPDSFARINTNFARQGNFEALRRWYTQGGGADIINWGTEGDFTRCMSLVSKYIPPEDAGGFCQNRHIEIYGEANATHDAKQKKESLVATVSRYEQIVAARESTIEPQKLALWKTRLHEFYNKNHDERGRFTTGGRLGTSKPSTVKEKAAYVAGEGPKLTKKLIGDDKVAATIARQAAVPGFEDFAGQTDRKALDGIINRQADNISAAVDRAFAISPEGATLHAEWYPFANQWIGDLAERTGFHEDAVTAAAAVLSPSADWADNIAWTKHIAETIKANPTVTREQVDAYYLTRLASWSKKKTAADEAGKKFDTEAPEYPGHLIGHKLSELSDADAAIAIRGGHDAGSKLFGRQPGIPLKKGEGAVYQLGGHAGFGNPKNRTIPQSDQNLAKAVSVLRNPSTENIDRNLGDEHKVRSFYNNLRNPRDTEFEEVTVDTHHYGLANGHPWTASTPFIKSGTASITAAPTTGVTGHSGTYALVVEATRKATDRVNKKYGTNFTPNQVQSIVWELHRAEYPDTIRSNKPMLESISSARSAFARGDISRKEMNSRVENARLGANGPTLDEIREWYSADLKGSTRPTLVQMRKARKGKK